MKLRLTFILLTFLIASNQFNKPEYFEGKIIYSMLTAGNYGSISPNVNSSEQEVYIKGTFFKFKSTKGIVSEVNLGEVIANSEDSSRYSVNHFTQTAISLGMERNAAAYKPKAVEYLHSNDSILGYECKKYKILQRDFLSGEDKIKHVWVAKDLKIKNLPLLAEIFGYQNTILKDGSLPGIILRSELVNENGDVQNLIKAKEIVPMPLEHTVFEVPDYYIRKNK